MDFFVSVANGLHRDQESVEARLRSEGLVPWTVERNVVSADAPLKAVTELRIAAMA